MFTCDWDVDLFKTFQSHSCWCALFVFAVGLFVLTACAVVDISDLVLEDLCTLL